MPLPSDERELVRRLIAKDRSAWNEFVRRYQAVVYARVERTAQQCRARPDRSDLEDLVAEVFASLLTNDLASLRNFAGKCSLATWLSVIARRVSIKQLTRKLPLPSIDAAQVEIADAFDGQHDTLGEMIRTEDLTRLKETLQLLGQGDQQILQLFYKEDLGYSEISKRMGISINTVGPKIHRAQQRLRKLLRWV